MTRDDPSDFGTIRRTLKGRELRAMLDMCIANPYTHLFPLQPKSSIRRALFHHALVQDSFAILIPSHYTQPMKPNVHEYPEHANERELLQYKIAVEQAALDGEPIEIADAGRDNWHLYHEECIGLPLFRWNEFYYRVARPKIAEGHNPAGVTEDQIPAGWRLFSLDEFKVVALDTGDVSDTRFWDGREWSEIGRWSITTLDGTLITQKPAGFYLPKPKIAEGHNPDNLTEDQVGVRDGWRLLTAEEMQSDRQPGIQFWSHFFHCWDEPDFCDGCPCESYTYRTKAAPGEYLPKPKPVQPTTVLGWLNTLPAGYRERALKNRRTDGDDLECLHLWVAVLRLPWASSPEGTEFWSAVYDAATRGTEYPPLPDAPKKVVPWSLDTFVWPDCVRRRGSGGKVFGVQLATEDGLCIGLHDSTCIGEHQPIDWKELADHFEYSTDNWKSWRPCCRTEDAS